MRLAELEFDQIPCWGGDSVQRAWPAFLASCECLAHGNPPESRRARRSPDHGGGARRFGSRLQAMRSVFSRFISSRGSFGRDGETSRGSSPAITNRNDGSPSGRGDSGRSGSQSTDGPAGHACKQCSRMGSRLRARGDADGRLEPIPIVAQSKQGV